MNYCNLIFVRSCFEAAKQVAGLDLILATCTFIKYSLLCNHFYQKSAVIRRVLRDHILACLDPALLLLVLEEVLAIRRKNTFQGDSPFQYRENVHFLLPPLILRLYTGCCLGQTLGKCITSFKK